MNKEKIYVNGVDVAGCDAYKDKHCMDKTSIMFCNLNICSNFPNCYYKQLKRLEEKYNKMVEISKENLIKYEDLRIKNEKFKNFVAGQMFYTDCENWLDRFIDYFNKWKKELVEENAQLKARLAPLEDSYFNSLSSIEIAGLAKKSIRITSYNRQLETELEELKEQFGIETLKNNDTNECVYRSNLLNKYKHALEEIKKLTVIGINASQCNCGLRALADDILQIITGAIGE